MVGFVAPNRYQPRAGWKEKLDGWVQFPSSAAGSWQTDITLYWRWTTLQGMSLRDAWAQLRMHPNNAASSLHPASTDTGLIPPDLFSHVLARARATAINPDDDVAPVIIDPEPIPAAAMAAAAAGGPSQVGFTPPNQYQPRAKWRDKLDDWVQFPPSTAGSWQMDITLYWRWTRLQGMSLMDAWTQLRMQPNNAASSLHKDSTDRGLIPPELFSHVLARSRAMKIDPDDNVDDVVILPEPQA